MTSKPLSSGDRVGVSTNTSRGVLLQVCDGTCQTRILLSTRETLNLVTDLIQAVIEINTRGK